MSLKQQVYDELLEAMKAKDELKLNTLRMLKSEIMKLEVSGTKKEASDDDVMTLTKRLIKQRKDASEQYDKGGRPELAEKENKEAEILEKYLPEQMSEDEVLKVVEETIKEMGATSKADMGKVMGSVMGKLQGQADGKMVNQIVSKLLA